MRAKMHSVFLYFAQPAHAENLESSRIGEDCPLPAHEFVEPAQAANELVSGTQVKMVGIAENDLRTQLFQHILWNCLDRTRSAAWHERRGFYGTMSGVNAAKARWACVSLNCVGNIHLNHVTGLLAADDLCLDRGMVRRGPLLLPPLLYPAGDGRQNEVEKQSCHRFVAVAGRRRKEEGSYQL